MRRDGGRRRQHQGEVTLRVPSGKRYFYFKEKKLQIDLLHRLSVQLRLEYNYQEVAEQSELTKHWDSQYI